jgi:hypothetical protein
VTAAEELRSVSDAASAALAELERSEIQQPLARLEEACDEAKRCWSGSSIGYHANVYWERLEPSCPVGQFNPEWGLQDAWPTYQPQEEWTVMEPRTVRELILARAGSPNLDEINAALRQVEDVFRVPPWGSVNPPPLGGPGSSHNRYR